jgi:S1-C subfamily serine protease
MNILRSISALAAAALLGVLIPSAGICQSDAEFNTIRKSLVKIYTRTSVPDIRSPWQNRGMGATTGSGVIIGENQILTNAHVVANQVNVEVKREGAPRRYNARVLHVGHECDLAIITVDDPEFFDGSLPMEIGETPYIRDSVSVYGFPLGGETISVTSGIVSRIEVSRYAHSGRSLLLVQIDAAINPGNSGGPVINDGLIAGIAAQSIRGADNVGYMVPVDIINHFIKDVEDGTSDGFPSLGLRLQSVENPGFKESLGLKEDESGVLVTGLNYGSSTWGVMEVGDVLLSIDGVDIAEDLSVPWRDNGRVNFTHLVHSKQIGEEAELTILRNGKIKKKKVVLSDAYKLIPLPSYDVKPSYYILGGLVFQPLSSDYMKTFKRTPSDMSYLASYENMRTEEQREIIVLSKVLASPFTRGYQGWNNVVIATVQGKVPRDMVELVDILEESSDRWLKVESRSGSTLVLDLSEAREKTAEIMKTYGIPEDRSGDMPK